MRKVAIISQKGGAGKTTLAVHLGTAASLGGVPTVIVDTDPQATATTWGEWRGGQDPTVISCASHAMLHRQIGKIEDAGAQLVLIDTPPAADVMAATVSKEADVLLIPCRPRAFDLDAIRTTTELVRVSGKPAFVVFTAGPANAANLYEEAAEVVERIGVKLAPFVICQRADFQNSVAKGRTAQEIDPDGKAAAEIKALWKWLRKVGGI
jgi:chromosome partitioning protein